MNQLKYLASYPGTIQTQIQQLLDQNQLAGIILKKYPAVHDIRTDKALYDYVLDIKNGYLRKTEPVSKITFDNKIHVINHALGLHTSISRVQGSKLKSKHEIRIASIFKEVPIEFLKMIVVHELAHLKEKEHDKAFYKLCEHMEPQYHQLEFDLRLYLTQIERYGKLF
ncbi:M48 family metallopeptidase [Iodobacter ciconiae]|uniref:M48 family peptidase n=1 Tax=Iodobacter ciconiae TaxID=2496266 RepID=A0A3S8ZQ33_9NEIS|nr:M48 family metallopeptidase [Iodobacter ciconiae]AZN35583.1 M48 family peptidase [Iodobacter ciconiae]